MNATHLVLTHLIAEEMHCSVIKHGMQKANVSDPIGYLATKICFPTNNHVSQWCTENWTHGEKAMKTKEQTIQMKSYRTFLKLCPSLASRCSPERNCVYISYRK